MKTGFAWDTIRHSLTEHTEKRQMGRGERMANYSGKIVRVADHGLAFVSTGSGVHRRDLPFTFDKIRQYRGQAADEIGLRNGASVEISEENGRVESVEILSSR
jgi:hypothetical protein